MRLNVYHLSIRFSYTQLWPDSDFQYDVHDGFVVIARDEKEARELVSRKESNLILDSDIKAKTITSIEISK